MGAFCKALGSLRAKVQAAGFTTVADTATGATAPIDEIAGDVDRVFDFRLAGLPRDAGMDRFDVPLVFRARYIDSGETAKSVAREDAVAVANTLINPAGWDRSIVSVECQEAGTFAELPVPGGTASHAIVASVPFTLVYSTAAP